MRILIYSYNYNPELIGIAPLMTELAEGFAKRTGVSDVRIANLLKAVENAPSGCQKILQFKTGGISAT